MSDAEENTQEKKGQDPASDQALATAPQDIPPVEPVQIPVPELPGFDPSKLQQHLDAESRSSTPSTRSDTRAIKDMLEEVADDLLPIMENLKALQLAMQHLNARLDKLEQAQQAGSFQIGKDLDSIRRELLSERKAFATRNTFNALLPTLDSLQQMHRGLEDGENESMRAQVYGIVTTLRNLVQGLGFAEFKPAPGAAFDPTCMECDGYAEGAPGVVLHVKRVGYRAGDALVRPAGVLIANPRSQNNQELPGSAQANPSTHQPDDAKD